VRQPAHTNPAAGTYTVTLLAKDNAGGSGTISKPVTVIAPPPSNQPPAASFTWSCSGLTCSFSDGSTDDVGITAWSWDFGDSSGISALQNPAYTYSGGGSYEVSLRVTDADGATTVVTNTVPIP
jgi:PKD repeat protein